MKVPQSSESGSAIVEFIGISIVLMVPLIFLASIVTLTARGTIAADASARAAARIFVISSSDSAARKQVNVVIARIVADHGLATSAQKVSIRCESKPCLSLGSAVTITVSLTQRMSALSTLGIGPRVVTSTSSHTMLVDEMRIQ